MGAHRLHYRGETLDISTARKDGSHAVTVDGAELSVALNRDGAHVTDGQRRFDAYFAVSKERIFVELDGRLFEFERPSSEGGSGADSAHHDVKDKLFAPMPGKVVKVLVSVGDSVVAKQPLVIVESMKMENQALSPAAGTIKAINFAAGDQVDTERALVELEIAE